jgi:hypothetical protein
MYPSGTPKKLCEVARDAVLPAPAVAPDDDVTSEAYAE